MCYAMYSGVSLYVISEPQCEMYCCVRFAWFNDDGWPVCICKGGASKATHLDSFSTMILPSSFVA